MRAAVLMIFGNRGGQHADIRLQETFPEVRFGVDGRDVAAERAPECADAANEITVTVGVVPLPCGFSASE
jgi:hypothetical protein